MNSINEKSIKLNWSIFAGVCEQRPKSAVMRFFFLLHQSCEAVPLESEMKSKDLEEIKKNIMGH